MHAKACAILDKAAGRKALESALREVAVPALPPLLVCGVGFNQQAWTQRVVAEKDAAEALAQVHRSSGILAFFQFLSNCGRH